MTRSRLAADLQRLGIEPGGLLMVHTRMSALGWVVGGSETVVRALLDALGPAGTVMAYAGWEDDTFDLATLPPAWRVAVEAETPGFDRATSEAVREHGRVPERIRTWPGALRSRHPEANVVALGPRAVWLVADHPWDDPYGHGSPLAKLVEADGQVLMLGAPLDTLTLLHHAEATARAGPKRRVAYRMPLLEGASVVWREFRDIDTSDGAFDYGLVAAEVAATTGMAEGEEVFAAIARQALAVGIGRSGIAAVAPSCLFPARGLHRFAERWLEARFGPHVETAPRPAGGPVSG
jgi:aminoglycoside 3-N-acetyltransferase